MKIERTLERTTFEDNKYTVSSDTEIYTLRELLTAIYDYDKDNKFQTVNLTLDEHHDGYGQRWEMSLKTDSSPLMLEIKNHIDPAWYEEHKNDIVCLRREAHDAWGHMYYYAFYPIKMRGEL